ncbi:MAG: NBR1-Ig-like domain-containing protein [Anaerolineales bacterium]|nr:NBR1-Ig-like domain-containing protein [Anaerolineales bacterium]
MKFRKFFWLAGTALFTVILSACNLGAAPAEDPGAIQTQAFNSVSTQAAFQQTQTAQALAPTSLPTNTPFATPTLGGFPTFAPLGGTNTPFAFNTQQPGFTPLAAASLAPTVGAYSTTTTSNGCNDGWLISESAPYDGATIKARKEFSKSWEFLNTGTCTWDEGYSFSFRPEYSKTPEGASIGYYGKDPVITKNDVFTKPGEKLTVTVNLTAPKKIGEYIWYWRLKDDAGNLFGSLVFIKFTSVEN